MPRKKVIPAEKTADKRPAGKRNAPVAHETPPAAVPATAGTAAITAFNTETAHPIVALGGSAGGLEALVEFFTAMPPASGMAFVVITHLPPDHKGVLPELIQRATDMPVVEIEEGMAAAPNRVHVIPSNHDVAIAGGIFRLYPPSAARGQRLPIDFFFRSLAEDQQASAVGIILSGMGSDGTSGIWAIKDHLGMIMVQDEASAKFDSMPHSAIATGLADYIAPPGDLPALLVKFMTSSAQSKKIFTTEQGMSEIDKVIAIIKAHMGHDFSLYKRNTLYRRIERRMSVNRIARLDQYLHFLRENPQEREIIFKELLIGVTNFFRDPEAFDFLVTTALPGLLQDGKKKTLRVWVPGCSSGEEAYSIAMAIQESLERVKPEQAIQVQIFATDMDKDAIDKARQALYPANIVADVSPQRLQRFFTEDGQRFRVRKEIREMLVFAPHNIIKDPPFTKLDLLCCRNLLIYFMPELQRKLLPLFHYALNPDGILFLGSSENTAGFSHLFAPLDKKWRIYRRLESPATLPGMLMQPSLATVGHDIPMPASLKGEPGPGFTEIIKGVLLEQCTPPAVLINKEGDILYIHGRTGKFLEPAAGRVNINIYAMAREGMRYELSGAIRTAMAQKAAVVLKGLNVKTDGSYKTVNVTIKPLLEPMQVEGSLLVIFEEVPTPRARRGRKAGPEEPTAESSAVAGLHEELHQLRERLRSLSEEMQLSQEELKSANEEQQSANEELQSTNEELMTSKEEMQSLNEELMSLNSELQTKNEDLSHANSDMTNLLNNTDIATIFLDRSFNVRRFTASAARIVNLIPSDIGRPMVHIVSNLIDVDLLTDAHQVLATLVFKEAEVRTRDGGWYLMRILPYRTLEDVIDGVVLIFVEISTLKRLQSSLEAARTLAESIINTVAQPLLVLDHSLRVKSANEAFCQTFQVARAETEGQLLPALSGGLWNIKELKDRLEIILPGKTRMENFLLEHDFPVIGYRRLLLDAVHVMSDDDSQAMIVLGFQDITDKRV